LLLLNKKLYIFFLIFLFNFLNNNYLNILLLLIFKYKLDWNIIFFIFNIKNINNFELFRDKQIEILRTKKIFRKNIFCIYK